MEVLRYPVLCWQIPQGPIMGHLVGQKYEILGNNIKKIKTTLSQQILRDLDQNWYGAQPSISKPRLKIIDIEVRPEYREKKGSYPTSSTIHISVAAVYGENTHGFYECFLPFLKEQFFFYDLEQINALVDHFSKNEFKGLAPEELYRYYMPSLPWLEEFSVRKKRNFLWHGNDDVAVNAPTLSKVSQRLPYSKSVREKTQIFPDLVWEQGEIIENLIEKIVKERANVLVVGNRAVGKSVILQEAIRRIHNIRKLSLRDKSKLTFWHTNPHRMISDAKYLGEWQEICEKIIDDLQRVHGILWISEFVDLLRVAGEGPEDSLAAFLMSFLRQGRIQILGEITPQQLESVRNILPSFAGLFQKIYVDEVSGKKLLRILQHFREYANGRLKIELQQDALELSYRLLSRFIKYESFPGKAIHFLGDCFNQAYLTKQKSITTTEIVKEFVQKTGMPELFLRDDLLLDEKEMKSFFQYHIIGQPQAIERVCTIVKIFKAGLNNPERPISAMMFTGPTGVGKTAMAKTLAEYFFGKGHKKNPLVRIDMSEFQHPGQIDRLIGTGKEVGSLVQQVREKIFCIILFDEIEKAHPVIFDTLLSLLDEGTLVDDYGRITDFRNTIIIMTSNLGTRNKSSIGFFENQIDYDSEIQAFFRPEFYNRLDIIVNFQALDSKIISLIADKELSEIGKREGFQNKKIHLKFRRSIVKFIIQQGFDEKYGARPLQRAIEKWIVSPIAQYLVDNRDTQNCQLVIEYRNNKVKISTKNLEQSVRMKKENL